MSYATPGDQQEIRKYADMKVSDQQTLTANTANSKNYDQTAANNPPFVYSKPAPLTEYDSLVSEALELQARCDSLNWIIDGLKEQKRNEKLGDKKQQLAANIATLNMESQRLQKLTDEKFEKAEKSKNGVVQSKSGNQDNVLAVKDSKPTPGIHEKALTEGPSESSFQQGVIAAKAVNDQVNSDFFILNSSPYSDSHPIPYASLPPGLVYRIQLGAFSKRVEENTFGGLSPVNMEILNEQGTTKYYVGYFTSIEDARQGLQQVKNYGFPDAFLVCYYNKKKITVEKAREIEFAEK